jgi:hypothetical protein
MGGGVEGAAARISESVRDSASSSYFYMLIYIWEVNDRTART